jgi:hypothetical protein
VTGRWAPGALALIDEAYDRERASDGVSRFGAYLRQHADRLCGSDVPLDAEEFAAAVWPVATAPIMAPGYVRVRPDVLGIEPTWGEDRDGRSRLVFEVRLALPHAAMTTVPAGAAGWRDWFRENGRVGEPYAWWSEPEADRPALLTSAVLRLPVTEAWGLAEPSQSPAPWSLLASAKHTVAAVADAVNELAGPVVDALRTERRWAA